MTREELLDELATIKNRLEEIRSREDALLERRAEIWNLILEDSPKSRTEIADASGITFHAVTIGLEKWRQKQGLPPLPSSRAKKAKKSAKKRGLAK